MRPIDAIMTMLLDSGVTNEQAQSVIIEIQNEFGGQDVYIHARKNDYDRHLREGETVSDVADRFDVTKEAVYTHISRRKRRRISGGIR